MDIVISVIAKVAEFSVKPIGCRIGYLIFYQSNVKGLEDQLRALENMKGRVQHKVEEARRNAEDIEVDVLEWLTKVDKITKEIKIIHLDENQSKNKCCSGLFSAQRYRLSKRAKIDASIVIKIKEEGNFGNVSSRGALSGVGNAAIKGFLTFGSRKSVVKKIIEALMDSNVSMVGVYGMGGVGKTMLVKETSRQVRKARLFDEVVMVTIGQTPDIRSIQAKMGDMLSLFFKQESVEGRAALLQKRLKRENKILVVLDDMWEGLDLESVGIPYGEDHEGCKILVTSRHLNVLYNKMHIRNTFEVKFLSEEESWSFFKSMVGESLEKECPDLKSIAFEVAKECAGLPVVLSAVAKTLSGKSLPIWRDGLKTLQNPAAVPEGVGKKAYASIELSYKYIKGEEAKLLFLLCSMFLEDYDINIEKLLIYAIGLGLLHGIHSLAAARDRMVKLIDDLKSSCLLLDSERGDNYFKMHDVVRDVAIIIASRDDKMCTLSYGPGSAEWIEDAFGKYNAAFIKTENFHNLPQKLMFPKLELLVLDQGIPLESNIKMPEDFLMELTKLKVLELHNMQISLSSFHSLAHLQTLCLWFCELGNIDMIKDLNKLEILSFRGCKIKEVPPAIGQLTQLKSLDLKYCYKLEVIPPNVISKLTKLEELDMEESFVGWDRVELTSQKKKASLSELQFLTCLTTLYLCVPDGSIMPKQLFLVNLKLEKFQLVIGREWPDFKFNTSKVMYLKFDSQILLSEGIKRLLLRSEEVYIEVPVHGKDVLFELDKNDMPPLRNLHVFDIFYTQYLISEEASLKGFTNLELLSLNKMMSLENIIHEHLKVIPFANLKTIKVVECRMLRNLFLSSIMSELPNLQTIDVSDCERIEAIVAVEKEAKSQFECSKLRSLSLTDLPQLTSFCMEVELLRQVIQDDVQHSEIVEEYKLSDCIPFFKEQVAFPSLERLVLSGLHKLKTIWHDGLTLGSFSKLTSIEVTHCRSLTIVFPSNTIRMLKSLEKLEVRDCESIEEIFEIQWSNTCEEGDIFASQLRYLDLNDLPRLKNVWNRDPQEWITFQNLAGVTVKGCHELKSLFPPSFTTNLQLLESLDLVGCGLEEIFLKEERFETTKTQFVFSKVSFLFLDCTLVMRDLWHGQSPRLVFPKLTALALLGSDYYKWPISMNNLPFELLDVLLIVEELLVIYTFLVELFPNEGICTARLRRLSLLRLPKLVHLWKANLQATPSFHNLEYLEVEDCGQLKFLFPSSFALHNLKTIIVVACHGLSHLMDSSVAKTLVQLQEMRLSACKRMVTVIAKGEGEEEDEIVFNKLKVLELCNLPNLSTFHSGKNTFRFPCLEKVVLKKCPEMKAFSCGVVSAPEHYWYVECGSDEGFWTSNVNATVNQLWDNDIDTCLQSLFMEEVCVLIESTN